MKEQTVFTRAMRLGPFLTLILLSHPAGQRVPASLQAAKRTDPCSAFKPGTRHRNLLSK